MEVLDVARILLIITIAATAQRITTSVERQPQAPGSLGKYFMYVNCTDCDVNSDLKVKEAEKNETTVSSETTETTKSTKTTEKRRTTKKATVKPMEDKAEVGERREKGDKRKWRGGLPKRPRVPRPGFPRQRGKPGYPRQRGKPGYPRQRGKPGYPRQRGKPKRPSTKKYFDPSYTEEYVNPYLPEDKKDSGEDSGFEYSFDIESLPIYDDPNFKEINPQYHIIEDTESPSKKACTEEYVNPYLPKDKQNSNKGKTITPLFWFPEMARTEEYVNPSLSDERPQVNSDDAHAKFLEWIEKALSEFPYQPEESPDSGEDSWPEYPFFESPEGKARTEEYSNPFLPKEKQDSKKHPSTKRPSTSSPKKAHTGKYVNPLHSDKQDSSPFNSSPKKARKGEYVNPFLNEDNQYSGSDYDDDNVNPDLQYYKNLIMQKYENSAFRYADLQGIPEEKRMKEDSVICAYETVDESSGKIVETIDYSLLGKPCKFVSSPSNKVNMTVLFCKKYPKAKVCLMKEECPPPSRTKPNDNECDEQIILRKQNIKNKKKSEGRFKRQNPEYKSKLSTMGEKINRTTVIKK